MGTEHQPTKQQLVTFCNLFDGNRDAHGTDVGGAVREPLTAQKVLAHLTGGDGIGVYPIRHNNGAIEVVWGCCDIDTGDWREAYMLSTALKGMGMNVHVERSRSKGWHVWVFVPDWVPAAMMRRALKVAYKMIDLPAKEANPKQETLRPDQLGNYVRLPYKGWFGSEQPSRQVMVTDWDQNGDGQVLPFPQFVGMDRDSLLTPVSVVARWANKWIEPPRRTVTVVEGDVDVQRLMAALPPKLQKFINEGPKRDRSAGMVALAHKMRDQGADPAETLAILLHVDTVWGKNYADRANGEAYFNDIIERAYI
jgi:hypothetical protein